MKFRQKVRRVNDLEKERETEHGVFDLHLIEHTRGRGEREGDDEVRSGCKVQRPKVFEGHGKTFGFCFKENREPLKHIHAPAWCTRVISYILNIYFQSHMHPSQKSKNILPPPSESLSHVKSNHQEFTPFKESSSPDTNRKCHQSSDAIPVLCRPSCHVECL